MAKSGTETILVAEDHDGLREAAKEMLELLGYHVLLAATGEQAVEIFAAEHRSIDLVVLDLVMPGMSGLEAFQKMSAVKPGLPVVFTTGYATEADRVGSARQREFPILQKPYGSKEFGQKIRSVLDATS